jgi:hypothetical protein
MATTKTTDLAIRAFWNSFVKHQTGLESLTTADDPLFDIVLRKLQQIDQGLFFEYSLGPDEHQLIITAEGKRELFGLVETIVRQAPPIEGWIIIALKPRNGFPVRVVWLNHTLEISKVYFNPLNKEDSDELGLELLVPWIEEDEIEGCHRALLRAIDYGLGEKRFAELVSDTFVTPLKLEAVNQPGIPLRKLDDFIQWHCHNRSPH